MAADERAVADYDRALACAGEVVIDPNGMTIAMSKADVYYDRGNAYLRLGRYEAAVANYDSSLVLASKSAAAYNNRGVSRQRRGDREGACRDRSQACDLGYAPACAWVRDSCGTR